MEVSVSKKEKINSLLLVLFLFETLCCKIIDSLINIPYISVVLMVLILLLTIVCNKKFEKVNIERAIIMFLFIILFLLLSCTLNGIENVINYVIYFVIFGLAALLISIIKCNYHYVFRYSILFSFAYLCFYFFIERSEFKLSSNYWVEQMGVAYAVSIIVVVCLSIVINIRLFQLKKLEKIIVFLNLCLSLYIVCIDCATRGAIVTIVIAIGLLFLQKIKSKKRKIFITILFLIISGTVFLNVDYFLILINNILNSVGINISAIDKAVWMLGQNIEDNGRNELYFFAIEIFQKYPLFGHGVGYFESLSGGIYVHNIVLELICEIGIIGTVIIVFYLIKYGRFLFMQQHSSNKIESIFYAVVFLITIPLLFFSSSFWLLPQFWLLFWNLIKTKVGGKND